MIPKTTEKEPKSTNRRGFPMSKSGPQVMGEAHRKNEVRVPIQEMEEFEVSGRRVTL
jgi:hypothetical protein